MAREWHFGSAAPKVEGKDGSFLIGPVAVNGDRELAGDAAKTLKEWVFATPYGDLDRVHRRFIQVFQDAERGLKFGDGETLGRSIQSNASEWLTAFRSFDDRTSHFLSRKFGHESVELLGFKQNLSREYDLNAAYRFCVKLRNYCQHVEDPVQHFNFQARLDESVAGGRVYEVTAEFDPGILLDRYEDWGAKVREDLQAARARFSVLDILTRAFGSCERVFAALIEVQRPAIEEAIETIEMFRSRVDREGDAPAFFEIDPDIFAPAQSEPRTFRLDPVRIDLAEGARKVLEQVETVLASPRE